MSAPAKARVLLTEHALDALAEIRSYSTREWGQQVAEKYLDDLQAGLERIRQRPDLVEPLPDLHPALGFYRVNKHLLVCDVLGKTIVVLTVMHASMDIPARLSELEPKLAEEVAMLHRSLHRRRR